MSRRTLAVAASSLVLAACFSRGAVHSYRTEDGRPLGEPGADAYLVWHDAAGWHLRARSETGRVFSGVVESSRIGQVAPVGVAPEALRTDGRAVAFAFAGSARGGEAGFDWQGGCADFSLYVGDDARPLRVFAGTYGASPPRIPFSLCP